MQKTVTLATAFALWTFAAQADEFTDAVLAKFQDRDFDYIEIKEGPTQVKVEAIKGTQKLEVIYDRATGGILKQEQERADADEIGRTGVEIDRRGEDFLDGDDLRDDDEDDDRRSGRDDDDDDENGHRSGRDDDEDHDDHDDDEDGDGDDHDDDDDDDDNNNDEDDDDEDD